MRSTRSAAALLALLCASGGAAAPRPEPAEVLGAEECGECHEAEHEVWSATAHARGWTELARSDAARAIAAELGIRRIKRDERCTTCHFLAAETGGEVKPVSGVACESCHGAGADWLDPHWDFGPGASSASEESAEHRAERLARCDELGMLRPGRVAGILATCVGCHVITDEALLVAGHPPPARLDYGGDATQGALRHNFVRGEGQNAPASPGRLRLLHAVGRLLEWAVVREALADAPPGEHAADVFAAADRALREQLESLQAETPHEALARALASAGDPALIREAASALGTAPTDGGLAELGPPAAE